MDENEALEIHREMVGADQRLNRQRHRVNRPQAFLGYSPVVQCGWCHAVNMYRFKPEVSTGTYCRECGKCGTNIAVVIS